MIKLLFSFYHQINILINNYMDNVYKKKQKRGVLAAMKMRLQPHFENLVSF